MRALIQRVLSASVAIDGEIRALIGHGLLVFIGIEEADDETEIEWLSLKISRMRIFSDSEGKMNLSLLDTCGGMLVVSQFTLHASTKKGNRPSFLRAAAADKSEPLYSAFCAKMEDILGKTIERGVFGADMKVSLINDGPVTIIMDSHNRE
ncbi:MAG: D-tyrosyl-tRNA(Tyr) deacylase [Armatimonadetes bacterium]|nr:D-tyrosyl-tRNA(Tyr) deacylase [Akkermansiaceae bacterium]